MGALGVQVLARSNRGGRNGLGVGVLVFVVQAP